MRILMLLLLAALVGLGGCTVQSRVASAAGTVVRLYCTNPVSNRALLRAVVDDATAPNRVRVECVDDAFFE